MTVIGFVYLHIETFDELEIEHEKLVYILHAESHPSLLSKLPSSHYSMFVTVMASPQIADVVFWLFTVLLF